MGQCVFPESNPTGTIGDGRTRYHCGTLSYTRAGLFLLFAGLLWGDFCFSYVRIVRRSGRSPAPLVRLSLGRLLSQQLFARRLRPALNLLAVVVCAPVLVQRRRRPDKRLSDRFPTSGGATRRYALGDKGTPIGELHSRC
ncbi:MAG: hypothetical protein ACYC26_16835 [Phycisphaerales bacterium]